MASPTLDSLSNEELTKKLNQLQQVRWLLIGVLVLFAGFLVYRLATVGGGGENIVPPIGGAFAVAFVSLRLKKRREALQAELARRGA